MRLILLYIICIFLCWEWGRWVVYLVSVYLVLFWFVYTEIPRVFWALGILFIYFCGVGRGILDLLGSEVYPVGMGLSLGCYTGLGT